jgi:dimethylglycine dehydrogenase
VNACIGLGMLKTDLNVAGQAVEVEIFGKRYPATVKADEPLWDAKNERIRA